MDYLEWDKREEEAPLIEATYQNHLVDDERLFTQEQQLSMTLTLFVLVGCSSN